MRYPDLGTNSMTIIETNADAAQKVKDAFPLIEVSAYGLTFRMA